MARITVEDCLEQINNRFALIHAAAKRVRQLRKGAEPTIQSKNKDIVVALREIAAQTVILLPQSIGEGPTLGSVEFLPVEGETGRPQEIKAPEVD